MKIGVCEMIPDVKYKVTGRRHDCGKLNQKVVMAQPRRHESLPLLTFCHHEMQFISSNNTSYCTVETEEREI